MSYTPIRKNRGIKIISEIRFDTVGFSLEAGTIKQYTGVCDYVLPDGSTLHAYVNSKAWIDAPVLGDGAFGKAYRITVGGTEFVLKHQTDYDVSRTHPASIMKECEILARFIGNPYVVQLLAAEITETDAYILSPYIPGMTLEDWWATNPSKEGRRHVYNAFLTGLQSIHGTGIVHRDIHPRNLYVPDNRAIPPFFLDFGRSMPISDTVRPELNYEMIATKVFSKNTEEEFLPTVKSLNTVRNKSTVRFRKTRRRKF
jgi:serine/threonine protein kinase